MRPDQVFAGAVQPIRASAPISVERGTLNVRQTDALLASPSGGHFGVRDALPQQAQPLRARASARDHTVMMHRY